MAQLSFNIFILGVTGYIGGPLFRRLRALHPNAHFSALIRNKAHIAVFAAEGLQEPILGSSDEFDKIRKASSEADLVLNIADCDDVQMTKAVLAGHKDRFAATGRVPLLLHTSGTGVLMDRARGNFNAELAAVPYDDASEDAIKSIPPEAIHRNVDSLIFSANDEGYVNAWIICPPTIYGISNGPLSRESRQVPAIIELALRAGRTVYANEGTATWDNVHIEDLLDLYELLLGHALDPKTKVPSSAYSKYYFAGSGQHTWGDLTREIALALHKRQRVPTAEATSMPYEEAESLQPWVIAVSTNSFGVTTRAKQLGWVPKYTDWREHIDADVEHYLANLRTI